MAHLHRYALGALLALAMLSGSVVCHADDYPSRPIRLLVPYPPGGLADLVARVLGEKLRTALGEPIIVENRPGASTTIGTEIVVKAKPDGYTLLLQTSSLTINEALMRQRYRVLEDLAPIAMVATTPSILVVTDALPVHSVKQLVALAGSQPGKLTYASAGNGSPSHFAGEKLRTAAGIDLLHVPYQGAPPGMNAMLAGQISLQFANPAVALPHIKSGRIRALAVASTKRAAALPNVPTMEEAGLPLTADQWIGYFAPRDTPPVLLERLAGVLREAMALDEVKSAFAKVALEGISSSTPASFARYLADDIAMYRKIAGDAKIKSDP